MKRILLLLALVGCHKDPTPDPAPMPPSGPITIIQGENGKQFYTGLLHQSPELEKLGKVHMQFAPDECDNLPAEFDLRQLGLVSDIRDQGQCGSCWAFSKTNSLESALLGIGKKLNLSEQELVSCDKQQYGCNGGMLDDFEYQISHGQGLESDFPYTASNSRCKSIGVAAKGISFAYIGSASNGPTEKELKCALYKYKTVPWITVSADGDWSSPPASEKTMWSRCSHGGTNHAVGVVGWHTINGKVGFIMKNSWGNDWGDNGYATLPLGCDSFGEEVAFIQIDKPTPPPPPPPTPVPPTPTPDPCVPPKIKLPSVVLVQPGAEVMLGVKAQPGWSFSWFADGVAMPGMVDSMIYVTPAKDTIYKLVASSSCGSAESSVKVSLLVTAKPVK